MKLFKFFTQSCMVSWIIYETYRAFRETINSFVDIIQNVVLFFVSINGLAKITQNFLVFCKTTTSSVWYARNLLIVCETIHGPVSYIQNYPWFCFIYTELTAFCTKGAELLKGFVVKLQNFLKFPELKKVRYKSAQPFLFLKT